MAPNKRNPLQQCSGFFVVWDKANISGQNPMLHSKMKQRVEVPELAFMLTSAIVTFKDVVLDFVP
ncbi:hypothetical protein [Pseudoalteromonas sp. H105]|uniref:hypothetical protein n=1 Tax=Pseudoalteromonas sp. H105 TaxID=1348393 RepID=UPI000731FE2C|nr:hypothetical protein [Pseudoalteromonas sp. H105]KTF10299.1 hypothetical protein ATS75_19195 [Pseudoalteromonas sp. H105]